MAISEWFKDDPTQIAWAREYIRRQSELDNFRMPIAPPPRAFDWSFKWEYQAVLEMLQQKEREAFGTQRIDKMRRAWMNIKSKQKSGKSTRSYYLSKEADRRLSILALWVNSTKSATLEMLIERGFGFEDRERKARKDALEAEKSRRKSDPARGIKARDDRILKELEDRIETTTRLVEGLLRLIAQREAILDLRPSMNRTFGPEIQTRANDRHTALQSLFEQRVDPSVILSNLPDLMPPGSLTSSSGGQHPT